MANNEHPPEGGGTVDRQRSLDRHRQQVEEERSKGVFRGSSVTSARAPDWQQRPWTSRLIHRIGDVAGRSRAGIVAATLMVAWGIVGLVSGFPTWWQTTLYSVTAASTFVMVFVIQHRQERQNAGTQRKLDELIRSSTHADNNLIAVEEAAEEDLEALTNLNLDDRSKAVSECPRSGDIP
jgi:low affinity Fe/Cu permease